MSDARKRSPIVQERVLPAPPAEVFRAFGDADSMRHWMCPSDLESADVEVDFQVGGRFRIVMHGAEQDYAQHGEYLTIDPPKRLVFTWASEWVVEAERLTRVEVTFEPAGRDETLIRLVHDELPDTDTYDGHDAGWASILEKLEVHLRETGDTS